eukprot:EC800105.1.p1 GENE.EC800105.1~~EC800105.1.p1  ORF type:complete len:203 (+),score=76.40 EC800105.1:157-765(+)
MNREETEGLRDSLPEDMRDIDILVNNAGLARGYPKAWEASAINVDQVFDTNVKALIQLVRLFVPRMIERGSGHIINVASIAGIETYPHGSVYCASKFAVRAYTESLRKELVNTPVNVSMVSPGLVETEFFVQRLDGDEAAASKVLEGDVALSPRDIADAVVWIATRPARVQVGEIVITSTRQGGVLQTHRGPFVGGAASSSQ